MSIQVHQLIIHEIEKDAGSAEVKLYLSEEQTPVDGKAEQLIRQLNDTFIQKEAILNGYFSESENLSFPAFYRKLAGNRFAGESFIRFSRETMELLRIGIKGVLAAKGGYMVYADYDYLGDRFTGVFLVRDADGLIFRKDSAHHSFQLDTVTYLNTERLAMACLVDLKRFGNDAGRYLQIIKHAKTQREISEYFLTWLGIERPESSREFTQSFLQLVNDLPLPMDPENGRPLEDSTFRREVVAFAMSNPHKTIDIREFDRHFYGEETVTQDFIQKKDITLDTEFRFDPGLLRQLYKYRVSAEGITLGFSRSDFTSKKITVQGNMVLIESQALADRINELFPDE